MFYIRHALTLIYGVLFVLLICGACITLFKSPQIRMTNVMGSVVTSVNMEKYGISASLNNALPGADITAEITIDLWRITVDGSVNLSYYGYATQHIYQKYNVEDLPCKPFAHTLKTAQVFGLLSIFTAFTCLVLVVSSFFSRLFLPVLWVMTWVNVACVSAACSMLLRLLCDSSCDDTDDVIPPFYQLAVPEGGFAMYIICMLSYLITSIMCIFL